MDTALLDRFKDPQLSRRLIERICSLTTQIDNKHTNARQISAQTTGQTAHQTSATGQNSNKQSAKTLNIMEVCGTHTVAIARSGLRSVLPQSIKLISGPGCPVCVTANCDIDYMIAASRLPQVTITTFGDMMRVPGSSTSLQQQKALGAKVEVVYSPLDALEMARQNTQQHIMFVAVGFETTTPLIAATLKRAAAAGVENFSVLTAHKRVAPALDALAHDEEVALDALILPGHVSTILGVEPYQFLAERYKIPAVIAGFEPVDLLLAIAELLEQILSGQPSIEIAYGRAVHAQGNVQARAVIDEVFEVVDATWRGLGRIPLSGHALREEYARFDAAKRFDIALLAEPTVEPKGCKCGEVLRGVMAPPACPLFGKVCTPVNPIGPCMVSGEGSCAAYYKYQIG